MYKISLAEFVSHALRDLSDRNGIYGVQVYVDGKDAEGRDKYLNEDMTTHSHRTFTKNHNAKLDRLLSETEIDEKYYEEKETYGLLIE
jgi:hypothetical protein